MIIINTLINKFINGLPSLSETILISLSSVFFSFIYSLIVAHLKKSGLETGYTRKIFHFLVFISASIVNYFYGFSGVSIFGVAVSLIIFIALLRNNKSMFYEAIARESDSPHRSLYVIIPYISTLIGGLTINFLFSQYVSLGYLITGVADASGEVVGTRFGKHKYKISFTSIHNSVKSIEGSISIFLISTIIYLSYAMFFIEFLDLYLFLLIISCGLLTTLIENISPKGTDNLTLQIVSVVLFEFLVMNSHQVR